MLEELRRTFSRLRSNSFSMNEALLAYASRCSGLRKKKRTIQSNARNPSTPSVGPFIRRLESSYSFIGGSQDQVWFQRSEAGKVMQWSKHVDMRKRRLHAARQRLVRCATE